MLKAMVIGLEAYPLMEPGLHAQGNDIPYGTEGAIAFYDWLIRSGELKEEEVSLYLSPREKHPKAKDANRDLITRGLKELRESQPAGGRRFFFFSGHGFSSTETLNGQHADFIACADFQTPGNLQPAIRTDDIAAWLRHMGTCEVYCFFDCCRNSIVDAKLNGGQLGLNAPPDFTNSESYQFILFAARPSEMTNAKSPFAASLIKALSSNPMNRTAESLTQPLQVFMEDLLQGGYPPDVQIKGSTHKDIVPKNLSSSFAQKFFNIYPDEFKPKPIYWKILLTAFSVGVIQFIMAFGANILGDNLSAKEPYFGYISLYHWSFIYITLIPLIVAGSGQTLHEFFINIHDKRQKIFIAVAIAFGIIIPLYLVGGEYIDAINPTWVNHHDIKYCQWNYVSCDHYIKNSQAQNVIRILLRNLSYLHYLVAYIFFASAEFSCLSLWIASRKIPLSNQIIVHQAAYARYASALYLSYIVVLRSAKVSIMLETKHSAVRLQEIWTLFTNLKTYGDISFIKSHIFFAIWALTVVICFLMNISLLSKLKEGELSMSAIGREKIIKRYIMISLTQLCFVVFPPPNGTHLIALSALILLSIMAVSNKKENKSRQAHQRVI